MTTSEDCGSFPGRAGGVPGLDGVRAGAVYWSPHLCTFEPEMWSENVEINLERLRLSWKGAGEAVL